MTQEYLNNYYTIFSCNLSCLATKYTDALSIGSNCSEKLGIDLIIVSNLLKILCLIKEDEECLDDYEKCLIINKIKNIFKLNKCECKC